MIRCKRPTKDTKLPKKPPKQNEVNIQMMIENGLISEKELLLSLLEYKIKNFEIHNVSLYRIKDDIKVINYIINKL